MKPRGITKAHQQKRTITEYVNVPAHLARVETPEFARMRHQLVVVEDRGCLVCGVRQSTLHDPAHNPCGAKYLEAHHRLVEWSLTECIDLAKFNAKIVAAFRREGKPGYAEDFDQVAMEQWIDHSPDNIWILCDFHHVGVGTGIHDLTYPVWGVQDLLLPGYVLTQRPGIPPPPRDPPPRTPATVRIVGQPKKALRVRGGGNPPAESDAAPEEQ